MTVVATTLIALRSSAMPAEAGERWTSDGGLGFLAADCRPGSAFSAVRDPVIAEAVAARLADALALSPHADGHAGRHHLVEADFRGHGRSVLRCYIPAEAAVP